MPELLDERRADILGSIVREYIQTAEPVGSTKVRERSNFDVSSATIRNDMALLEVAGYLESPHTSAGRIPTEKAYRYYVDHFLSDVNVPISEEQKLRDIWKLSQPIEEGLKSTAKVVAEFAAEGVFLALGKNDIYYTGLANLFSQPEFREQSHLYQMSITIDNLDEAIADLFAEIKDNEVRILVGSENPLGDYCSVILARYNLSTDEEGILGILGPTRMDYDINVARASYACDCINKR